MSIVYKIKATIVRRLMHAMGVEDLHARVHTLEVRAPIADSRMDHINRSFDAMSAGFSHQKKFNKLYDTHFQNLYDRLDDEQARLEAFQSGLEKRHKTVDQRLQSSEERSKAIEEGLQSSDERQKVVEERLQSSDERSKAVEARLQSSEEGRKAAEDAFVARLDEIGTKLDAEVAALRAQLEGASALRQEQEAIRLDQAALRGTFGEYISEVDQYYGAVNIFQNALGDIFGSMSRSLGELLAHENISGDEIETLEVLRRQLEQFKRQVFFLRKTSPAGGPAESAADTSKWLLITNTQPAGTMWFGSILASSDDVVYQHSRVSMLDEDSVFGAAIDSFSVPKEFKGIEKEPEKFSIADHFSFLEYNVPAAQYVQADVGSFQHLLNNLSCMPSQCPVLHAHGFQVRNMVMDPVRLISVMQRLFKHQIETIGSYPDNPPYDFDEELYQEVKPKDVEAYSDDDLFIRVVLYLANILSRDLTLANLYGVETICFERLYADREYLQTYVGDLSGGAIAISDKQLDDFYAPEKQNWARSHRSGATESAPEPGQRRDVANEAKVFYSGLAQWQQGLIDRVYSLYGVFDLYAPLGYAFDYVGKPQKAARVKSGAKSAKPQHVKPVFDQQLQELLKQSSPELDGAPQEEKGESGPA